MPYEGEDSPFAEPDPELDALASSVIGAAIEAHRRVGGPGLDEPLYAACLHRELGLRGIPFLKEVFR